MRSQLIHDSDSIRGHHHCTSSVISKKEKKKRNKTSLSVSVRMSVQFLSSVFLWSISIRRGEAQCNEERRGGEEKEGERVQSAEE